MKVVIRRSGRAEGFVVAKKERKKEKDCHILENAPKMFDKDPSPPPSRDSLLHSPCLNLDALAKFFTGNSNLSFQSHYASGESFSCLSHYILTYF